MIGSLLLGSGFMLIRSGEVIFRTKEQQFNFNFPYQLGPTSRAQAKDADVAELELQEGDKIVLGTDGLFDNLFDHEILEVVNKLTMPLDSQEEALNSIKEKLLHEEAETQPTTKLDLRSSIAEQLARKASEKARSNSCKTPFSQNAKLHGYKMQGGKLDDITVVFSVVTSIDKESSPTPSQRS
jgi:serine/threonine protein phosphatase PrpC